MAQTSHFCGMSTLLTLDMLCLQQCESSGGNRPSDEELKEITQKMWEQDTTRVSESGYDLDFNGNE